MTLHIERARTRRPITWLTLIGVLLLPVLIGGILVAALYNPAERLDNMSAAIVNEDEPVTIDDQFVPLGRQLTAGLVEGSDEIASNLDWTISNADDAAAGLADGTYQAVVTIPSNFSAAATSTAPGGTPEQATIEVSTPPDSKVVDDAITAQVTSAAASIMGQQLSQVYLENVFVGFTTLGDQLGEAAAGAHQLADGAQQAADGAAQLPGGASQLGSGASQLSSGAGALASGLDQIASGTAASASGAGQLADGLDTAAAQVNNQQLVGAAQATATYAATAASQTAALAQSVGGLAQTLGGLAGECIAEGGSVDFCTSLGTAAATAGTAATDAVAAATSAGTASGYAAPTAAGIQQLTSQTSAGLTEAAAQTRTLAAGLTQLASGTTQSADGARGLQSGASQLSDGATQLSDGAGTLATGVQSVADGTTTLADGLDQASAALPSYSDSDATSLATVVADPVATDGVGLIALRRVGRAAAGDARSVVRRTRNVRGAAGGFAPRPDLAIAVRRSRAARARPRGRARGRAGPARGRRGAVGRVVRLDAVVAVRGDVRHRGSRLRRRQPGARGRVRRRRPVARCPRGRAGRGHWGGLHRARRAVGRGRTASDRARVQRHARGPDRLRRPRRGDRRAADLGGPLVHRDDDRRRATTRRPRGRPVGGIPRSGLGAGH